MGKRVGKGYSRDETDVSLLPQMCVLEEVRIWDPQDNSGKSHEKLLED
jgi:hypothetical protein